MENRSLPAIARTLSWAILRGLLYFGVVMGVCIGLITLNARNAPGVIWFPVPIAAVLVAAAWWAERRWRIGLVARLRIPLSHTILLSIAVMAVGDAACVLEGAWHGMVRDLEYVAEPVSAEFQTVYFFTLSALSAVLAEVTFRGIVQTRLHQMLRPWTVILLIAVINTAAHRWNQELAQQALGFMVMLAALGYLRWQTGSLWPPLLVHLVNNLLMAASLSHFGPFEQGELTLTELLTIGAVGLACLAVAVVIGRKLPDSDRHSLRRSSMVDPRHGHF